MNEYPLLSIIVPIYNVEQYAADCINSILTQPFSDFELILVDDGSTDSSGSIADSFAEQERVSVIHTDNQGLSAARNNGFKLAHGEYVFFMDSDDLMIPDRLEHIMNGVREQSAPVTTFWLDAFDDPTGNEIDLGYAWNEDIVRTGNFGESLNELIKYECVPWSTSVNVFKSDFLKRNDLWFLVEADGVEDCRFYLDVMKKLEAENGRVGYVPMPLVRYRMNRKGSIMYTPNLSKYEARGIAYTMWVEYADELIHKYGAGSDIKRRMGDAFFYNTLQLHERLPEDEFYKIAQKYVGLYAFGTGAKKKMFHAMCRVQGVKGALGLVERVLK